MILTLQACAALGQPAPSTAARTGETSTSIAPPATPPRLILQADADSSFLELREAGQWDGKLGWRPLCVAPCGVPLLAGYEFRVAAGGKVVSAPFVLPDSAPATVYAHMGSRRQQVTGIWLASVGGGIAGMALTFAGLSTDCSGELGCDRETVAEALVVASLSAGVLATGIYLLASSRTKVIVASSVPLSASRLRGAVWTAGAREP